MTFISDSNTLTGSMNAVGRPWWVYMLECRGGGIYIGIALDVDARFAQHVAGKGAKYTRLNAPVRILVRVRFDSHREAAQAEVALKRLKPLEKWRWAYAFGESETLRKLP